MRNQPILLPKRVSDAHIASLAGLEQRTDRFEPFDHRIANSSPGASYNANSVYLSHFRLAHDFTVAKIGIYIGGTSAGNVDLGIATSDDMTTFAKVASSGSVAAGAINTIMEQALSTPFVCVAGLNYWFMFGLTNATLVLRHTQSTAAIGLPQRVSMEKAGAWSSGLPASVTGVAGTAFTPWFTLIAPGA